MNILDSILSDEVLSSGGTVASELALLTDVVLSSPTNGQAIVYNTATTKWINSTVSGGSGFLPDVAGNLYAGTNAFASNINGGDNIVFGTGAFLTGTGGFSNIAIGVTSLEANSGSNNIALGENSAWNLTGDNNVAIGSGAGEAASAASSNNIFLGYGAGPTTNAPISNKLYINNSPTDTPLIYGDFSVPTLHINGTLSATNIVTTPPLTATSSGVAGAIAVDANFVYICTATNTWVRSAITTATW